MPRVPTYERQVRSQPLPGARLSSGAPIEAFGGGQANALPALGEFAKGVQGIIQEEFQKANRVQLTAYQAELAAWETESLYGQNGVFSRRGDKAFSAPEDTREAFDKFHDGLEEKYATNADLRRAISEAKLTRWADIERGVQKHVAVERKRYDDESHEAFLINERNAAIASDDLLRIGQSIARSHDQIEAHGAGRPREAIEAEKLEASSKIHLGYVKRLLDDDKAPLAQTYFKDNAHGITEADRDVIQDHIENGMALHLGNQAWQALSKYRLADGMPDESRMRKELYADESLSEKQKKQTWDFVKARAGEARVDRLQAIEANDRAFMNEIITARKQGVPLPEALKLAQKRGFDPYDRLTKENAAKKMYSTAVQSNPAIWLTAYERVESGAATIEELNTLHDKNELSTDDWMKLRKSLIDQKLRGGSPEVKQTRERIAILAEEKYGANKKKRDAFLYEVDQAARGKSAEEMFKIANDKLKADASSGILWSNPQWQTDLRKRDAEMLALGKAYEDLGKDVVTQIGEGYLAKGAKDWGVVELDKFAEPFGGYDAIRPGTPVYEEIQWLIRNNKLVTVDNVKARLGARKLRKPSAATSVQATPLGRRIY